MAQSSSVVPNPRRSIPDGWPRAVYELYDPIRVIGTGGFASVWMARERTSTTKRNTTGALAVAGTVTGGRPRNDGNDEYVAIKIVKDDDGRAMREISILSELTCMSNPHPNIVRLLRSSFVSEEEEEEEDGAAPSSEECKSTIANNAGGRRGRRNTDAMITSKSTFPPPPPPPHCRAMVLSLAYGPTLYRILNDYGRLGLVVSNAISRQLIHAIAFLHGHAGELVLQGEKRIWRMNDAHRFSGRHRVGRV